MHVFESLHIKLYSVSHPEGIGYIFTVLLLDLIRSVVKGGGIGGINIPLIPPKAFSFLSQASPTVTAAAVHELIPTPATTYGTH